MLRVVISYGARTLLSLWLALTITFLALRMLPGDALAATFAQTGVSGDIIAAQRERLGLDDPLFLQYVRYIEQLLQGDLGESLVRGLSNARLLEQRLPVTAELAVFSMLIAIPLGFMIGILSAGQGIIKLIADGMMVLGLSVPIYWTATLVLLVLGALFRGSSGAVTMALITLSYHTASAIARTLSISLQETYGSDFIRTASAKGLSPVAILLRHQIPNAVLPVITVIAIQIGFLFSGTLITETIFQRPGIGLLLRDAALERDYTLVQAIVLLITLVYSIVNFVSDLLSYAADPRVRYS